MKTPALTAWRREIAAGERTPHTLDALWRAACAEQRGLEFVAAGLPLLAETARDEARRIIKRAVLEAAR